MNENLCEICMVLDRTGSMANVIDEVIRGFNEFVKGQREAPGECRMTLIQFDSQNPQEVVHDRLPIHEIPDLTDKTFIPRSMTPLYDAVGRAIANLGIKLNKEDEANRPGKVVFVIFTDGHENASREWTEPMIRTSIKHQREKYNWQFMFLGADIEAERIAAQMEIPTSNAVKLSKRHTGKAMSGASAKLAQYRGPGGQSAALHYSDAERKEYE